jgi:hypothetical protein
VNSAATTVLQASKPAQEFLNTHISREMEQRKLATLLPEPLHTLYFNLSSYAQLYRTFPIRWLYE